MKISVEFEKGWRVSMMSCMIFMLFFNGRNLRKPSYTIVEEAFKAKHYYHPYYYLYVIVFVIV